MRQEDSQLTKLLQQYNQSNEVDRHIFAEMRSNIMLAMGDHYNRRYSRIWGRIRDSRQFNDEQQRMRITKNHIHRISRIYINNIVNQAPGVAIQPQREEELQDVKAAELNGAVWEDIKHRHRIREKIREWACDFIDIGEVWTKVFWDPNAGRFLGYEQEIDENGEGKFDVDGEPLPSKRPVFTGDIAFERHYGFNVLRDPNAKEVKEGYKIVRKMVDKKIMQARYAGDEDKLSYIQDSSNDVWTVYEGSSGNFYRTKDQVLVKEFYYPKSEEHPKGKFMIATEHGVLEEGELPFGIFPMITTGFDEIQTTPRRRSIIKQLRPTQAEINRVASQIAIHQITVGDDKLLVQAGSKVTQGGMLPGVRVVKYSGAPPTHLPGRAGDQYFTYLESQIKELYQIAGIEDEIAEKQQNPDMMVELMKSIKQKKQFSLYVEKFERFLQDICEQCLRLAKEYYTDDMLVPAIGRNEYINVEEFRTTEDLGYRIVTEPQTEDYETKMGKQITFNNILQYVGGNLEKEDIGQLIRSMPYTNKEQMFSAWTTDYDNITNDILALDRGEMPEQQRHENHKYALARLVHRTKQPDFRYLDPQIQQNYNQKIQEHEQAEIEEQQKLKAMESEFIPSTGPLVKADIYVSDPDKPSKTSRAKIPMDALEWLLKQLETQGVNMKELERLQQSAAAEVAEGFLQQGQIPQAPLDQESADNMVMQAQMAERMGPQ
jgi:hypothetical protein